MTVSRVGLLTGLMISLPFVIWAAGILTEAHEFHDFAPHLLFPGLKAMFAAQAVVLTILVPWCSLRFSWTEIIVGLMVLVLVPLPVLCLSWLMHLVRAVVLERGIFLLLLETALMLVISKGIFYMAPGLVTKMVASAGMQALFATGVFALRDRWLAWIGL